MIFDSADTNRWTVTLTSAAGQNLQGDQVAAWLAFGTDLNPHSAIVPLEPLTPLASIASGTSLAGGAASGGRIFLVGREPLLDMVSPAWFRLYGHPGTRYEIDGSLALGSGSSWTNLSTFVLPGRFLDVTNLLPSVPTAFFRAVELEPSGPWLELWPSSPSLTLRLHGSPGTTYDLLRATNLLGPWLPSGSMSFTNSLLLSPWTNRGEPAQFFRLERH
jgi:hypothetical protein